MIGVLIAAAGVIEPAAASAAQKPAVDAPTSLSTSPTSDCQGDTILGDGDVTLYAAASSPSGGSLATAFQLTYAGTHSIVAAATVNAASGTNAVLRLPKATLESAADGAITEFDWKARATDSSGETSGWSATCHFSFDPTRPGTPVVTPPESSTIGKPVSIAVTAPAGGVLPSRYQYQLNGTAPLDVPADASGNATITLTPTRRTNILSVVGLSAGGNFGDTVNLTFDSAVPPPDLTDADLNGDGVPDLVTVGAQHGLPSGLWLAAGTGDGHVATSPTDIGIKGAGFSSTGSPSDFDGGTAITGRFTGGFEQDVLIYNFSGPRAGCGEILPGNDTGAPLDPNGEVSISCGFLQDLDGNNPVQLANAGDISGLGSGYPSLLGVLGNSTDGYGLDLYTTVGTGGFSLPYALNADTPDGTADWQNWTIATAQLPTADGTGSTAMFLWNKSTGELDLWENLAADPDTGALSYTAYPVATDWNTGADITLQAADVNGDGVPDLWTVGAGEQVTANLVSGLSATGPAVVDQVSETLDAVG